MLDKISQKPTALFDISFNSRVNVTFAASFYHLETQKRRENKFLAPKRLRVINKLP